MEKEVEGRRYIPVFMIGMGTSLPKGGLFVLPYNASIHFGKPTIPLSTDIQTIMEQIEEDFNTMIEKYGIKEDEDDD